MGFDCASRTHLGCRRKLNEDAVLSSAERGIWAVADGMGGHDAGEVASAMVVDALSDFPAASSLENLVGKVLAALESVNDALIEMARGGFEKRVIGSTVVGLVADDAQYRCFWVGDSRAFRIRGNGIVQLTRDHSLVQDLVEAGMLKADEAENHPNANVVTRAVGASEPLQVDTVGGELRSGDVFLLASDGLTRVVAEAELLDQISSNDLEAAADNLIELTLARGAPDNVSLVIVRVR
ncbi:MAG: protein phosphatase 2C domain-containing protein [Novosphingobium sp.]